MVRLKAASPSVRRPCELRSTLFRKIQVLEGLKQGDKVILPS